MVRAAGGVIAREGGDGRSEVLLVHRPKYDDWSFPKGKRDPAETDEQCAVREVEEETGLRCHLGRELLPTAYDDARDRPKVVRYWEMTVVHESPFVPGRETDELAWVPIDEAAEVLSYERDSEVLRSLAVAHVGRWSQ